MVKHCVVFGCTNRPGSVEKQSFYRIPAVISKENKFYKGVSSSKQGEDVESLSKRRREAWIRALKLSSSSESTLDNARVCGKHFLPGSPAVIQDDLHPDWVPSQPLGYSFGMALKRKSSLAIHERFEKRQKTREVANFISDNISTDISNEVPEDFQLEQGSHDLSHDERRMDVSTQTDLSMKEFTISINCITGNLVWQTK